ncbi:hypothetical protein UCRPC4_g02546 [Phaeomoniella chlamydospora]|uniref:Uncharacterized protein n=1 Tax=Phaeomoniella chlamydospora TaxID=158046 RepID=A0A0G2H645_PHACM|nr:hypothetical protein UCRPC4_g02546 [Phaeomoniella chlamydospora]
MQLISSSGDEAGGDGSAEDEDVTSVSLTIIPSPSPLDSSAPAETLATTQETTSDPTPTEATLLFTALSACSNLHPDPIDENEDDGQQNPAFASSALFQAGLIQPGSQTGDLPPPMPGSGGWITAENIGDYVDEEGNWIGGGDGNGADEAGEEENVDGEEATPLGPGAGTIRSREGDSEAAEGDETDETKWRRTS